jgi:prepilin-type N-terminal cleavage/methylation domain-containing protein
MDAFKSHRKSCGFTLLETLVAIAILTIGLLSIALLVARATASSNTSRYMSTQSLLASEKLDDLNRLPASDPAIAVPGGATAGSLTADTNQMVTVGAVTQNVDYFDVIQIAGSNGSVAETLTATNAAGVTSYTTTTHTPNGAVTQTVSNAAPAPNPDTITFGRRWIIEKDTPIPGTRRITVVVRVINEAQTAPFQMSMVRQ